MNSCQHAMSAPRLTPLYTFRYTNIIINLYIVWCLLFTEWLVNDLLKITQQNFFWHIDTGLQVVLLYKYSEWAIVIGLWRHTSIIALTNFSLETTKQLSIKHHREISCVFLLSVQRHLCNILLSIYLCDTENKYYHLLKVP